MGCVAGLCFGYSPACGPFFKKRRQPLLAFRRYANSGDALAGGVDEAIVDVAFGDLEQQLFCLRHGLWAVVG